MSEEKTNEVRLEKPLKLVEIVAEAPTPKNLLRFAFWKPDYQGTLAYQNGSCSSFCSGGACTTGLKDKGYFGEVKTYKNEN